MSEKNFSNLKSFDKMEPERHKQISSKGGRNSAKARRKREEMRETVSMLLNLTLEKGKHKSIEDIKSMADVEGKNITVQEAIIYALAGKAVKGDVNAAAFLRDTLGEKPGLDANINLALPIFEGEDELEE